jgi:hypothetical protein
MSVDIKNFTNNQMKLKKFYRTQRLEKIENDQDLENIFKPITKPLKNINDALTTAQPQYVPAIEAQPQYVPAIESTPVLADIGEIAKKYLGNYISKKVKTDNTFGINYDRGSMKIGNHKINVIENDIIFSEDQDVFQGTEGLWQLLTLDQPDVFEIQDLDLDNFWKILDKTNSYRHNNDPSSTSVKSSSGYKYKYIVRPLLIKHGILKDKTKPRTENVYQSQSGSDSPRQILPEPSPATIGRFKNGSGFYANPKRGKGFRNTSDPLVLDTTLKKVVNHFLNGRPLKSILKEVKKIQLSSRVGRFKYKRWDSINELFYRLIVIYGEIQSGNNNPALRDEVVAIFQELKEIK